MILVVYDSFFGNTKQVALSIAKTLKATAVHVAEQPSVKGVTLLIIGSPTRAFRPTPAITSYLSSLPSLKGIRVAAFDTRILEQDATNAFLRFMMKLFGWASQPINKQLVKKGGTSLGTIGIGVTDTKGPLKEGELKRATTWAQALLE
jgi:flavodoxin